MQAFVVFAAVVAAVSANPQVLVNNLGQLVHSGAAITYSTPVVSHAAVVAPAVTKTQYHSQNEQGAAIYGYNYGSAASHAIRDAAGNVRGSYAYINPEGKEVRVQYVADDGGFRVASNALPVGPVAPAGAIQALVAPAAVADTPEVIQARAAHLQAHAEALARTGRKKRALLTSAVIPTTSALGYSSVIAHPSAYSTVALGHTIQTPVAYSAAPVAYSSPLAYTAYSAPVVAAPTVREATLTKIHNNPGHAVSYRVD